MMETKEKTWYGNEESIDSKHHEISKSRKEQMKEEVNYLEEPPKDPDNMEEDMFYELKITKNSTDNILKISSIIDEMELIISGYSKQPQTDGDTIKYKKTGFRLAIKESIQNFIGLLRNHANQSNIVSKQKWDDFKIQAMDDWKSFAQNCVRESGVSEQKLDSYCRMFQGALIKIGEITCDNPENMKSIIGGVDGRKEEEDMRNAFK